MYEREPGGGVWVEHPPDQVLGVAGHPRPLLSGEVDATTEDRLHDLLVVVCICLFVAQCSFGRSEEKGTSPTSPEGRDATDDVTSQFSS